MKTLLVLGVAAFILTGCPSMQYAGTASYNAKPMELSNGTTVCCDITINNGKEYDSLVVHLAYRDGFFTLDLDEKKVAAFEGQKTAALVAQSAAKVAGTAALAAGAVLIAPIAAPAITGAAASGALPAVVVGAVGATAAGALAP